MNNIALIILAALIFDYVVNLLARVLTIKNLNESLPKEFEDTFNELLYAQSQRYTRDKTIFGMVFSTVFIIAILAFWFLGGFAELRSIVGALNLPFLLEGLMYLFGLGALIFIILSIPFDLFATFVIEEKYGFNRTTFGTFVSDKIKSIILTILLGGGVFTLILFIFDRFGPSAWLYCFVVVAVLMLIMQYLLPKFILPLFYTFTPLEDESLKRRILNFGERIGFHLEDVYVVDGSRRSTKANAFFTGFGKNKRVALFDTLLENYTEDELLTVLAHEIGHYKKHHIFRGLLISVIHMGIVLFFASEIIYMRGIYEAFYLDTTPIYAGFIFLGLLLIPFELVVAVIVNWATRRHEYQADSFAAKTTNDPESFIDALKKLTRNNFVNLSPPKLSVILNYSHPPVLERIRAMRKNYIQE